MDERQERKERKSSEEVVMRCKQFRRGRSYQFIGKTTLAMEGAVELFVTQCAIEVDLEGQNNNKKDE